MSYMVPTVIEKSPGGIERAFDIYSRLLKERIVFLGTPIDDGVANVIMAQLLHLEGEDPDKDINMYINSPGGSTYALMASQFPGSSPEGLSTNQITALLTSSRPGGRNGGNTHPLRNN